MNTPVRDVPAYCFRENCIICATVTSSEAVDTRTSRFGPIYMACRFDVYSSRALGIVSVGFMACSVILPAHPLSRKRGYGSHGSRDACTGCRESISGCAVFTRSSYPNGVSLGRSIGSALSASAELKRIIGMKTWTSGPIPSA